jgi:hypothetical protein
MKKEKGDERRCMKNKKECICAKKKKKEGMSVCE